MEENPVEGVFARLIDQIEAFVHDGVSVHLVGPHSSGRSALLGLVADRLDDAGATVLRLGGNAAWRGEPYGALLASGIGAAAPPGPRKPADEVTRALAQQLRGSAVVVADDADELDLPSAGALLTAHRQRPLVAVTSSLPHQPARPDSLMLGLAPAVRIRVPMLDFDEVHQVCQDVLGDRVEAGALARIAMKSGGLHGLVRTIATVGRHTGRLVRRRGVWTLPGDLWSEHLAAVVEPFLAGVEPEVWDGATTLAVTGPVSLDKAETLVGRTVLDRLMSARLVHHIDDGGVGVVGLYPPLLAEFLRREGSAFGLAHGRDLGGPSAFLPTARAYEAGLTSPFDTTQAVGADAAVLNQQMVGRAAAAVADARRAWEQEPVPETALPLLIALRAAGAPATQVEYVIAETPLTEESEATAMTVSWIAGWRAVYQADLPAGLRLLEKHEARMPRFAGLLRARRANLTFLRDRVPEPALLDEPAGSGSSTGDREPLGADLRACVRADLLVAGGQVDAARKLLAGLRPHDPVLADQATAARALADVLAGDIDAGVDRADDQLHAAYQRGHLRQIQAFSYVTILGLALAGRLGDASQLLFRTLSATTVDGFREIYHTGVLVLGAEIALGQGRPAYARNLAAQAIATERGTGPWPGMVPSVVTAMAAGDDAAAPDLWELVADRTGRGYVASAILLAVEANGQRPDAPRARAVRDTAAGTQSPLLRALGEYVVADAEHDLAGLARAIKSFVTTGARLYAVRAAVSRALALRAAGRAQEGVEQADAAWQLSSVAGIERSGLFAPLVNDVGLSARELEIVQLIATPMPAATVAATLQMSVRTVETHLHNTAHKLGTTGRQALVRATTTWLRPARHRADGGPGAPA
ncbi:helix-turn-helix transcriptional regulator [Promicromonospora panici]|uniref:helix-turn-helix transcriptional regulator n=1 Tax=Promicromonospora panici TaxID=2219658 RepID=UPI00101C9EDA|nr:LuxR family transcriptional regulator [Promicromonospora panici]